MTAHIPFTGVPEQHRWLYKSVLVTGEGIFEPVANRRRG